MKDSKGRMIEVRVHAGCSRREVVIKGSEIHVYTRKKPEKGEANLDVIAIISEYYKVPKSSVELLRGERAKVKLLRIASVRSTDEGRA